MRLKKEKRKQKEGKKKKAKKKSSTTHEEERIKQTRSQSQISNHRRVLSQSHSPNEGVCALIIA